MSSEKITTIWKSKELVALQKNYSNYLEAVSSKWYSSCMGCPFSKLSEIGRNQLRYLSIYTHTENYFERWKELKHSRYERHVTSYAFSTATLFMRQGKENHKFAKTSGHLALTILTKSRELVGENRGFTDCTECSGSCITFICR